MDEKNQVECGFWKLKIVYHFKKKIINFVMFKIFWMCSQSNTFPSTAATKVLF